MTLFRDAATAAAVAGVLSGAPSTVHSLLSGRDVLEPTLAAERCCYCTGRRARGWWPPPR